MWLPWVRLNNPRQERRQRWQEISYVLSPETHRGRPRGLAVTVTSVTTCLV